MHQENYTIVYIPVTSGLRASELIQLRWTDIECLEGTWTARFLGKGSRDAEQELYSGAVAACMNYFKLQFNRDVILGRKIIDFIHSLHTGAMRRAHCHITVFGARIKQIGATVVECGVIKRNINFSPHLFRRSYATALYKSGMGIKATQEKTRHASVEVLVKHYIHDVEAANPYFNKMIISSGSMSRIA
jgi:integrase